jgi:hypothetical protein
VQALVGGRQTAQHVAFADIHHHGGALDMAAGLVAQIGELGNQIEGEIIDAIEPQVLERLQNRPFA